MGMFRGARPLSIQGLLFLKSRHRSPKYHPMPGAICATASGLIMNDERC